MSTEAPAWLTVDRLEGSNAVLLSDDGDSFVVERDVLPTEAREGSVLLVPRDHSGFSWASAAVDRDEERRRREGAEQVLDELRKRDPGGDVRL